MKNLGSIGTIFLAIGILIGGVFAFNLNHLKAPAQEEAPILVGSTIPQVPAFTSDTLAVGIGKADTAITLVSGTDSQGRALSGYYGFVIDEGSSNQEIVGCTAAGTALTGCVRGLDTINGTSSTASLEQQHRRGASVKITNAPFDLVLSNILQGKDGLPSLIHYDTGTNCSVSSLSSTLCDKAYVDAQIAVGAAAANNTTAGISIIATAAQVAASTATKVFNAVSYNLVIPSALSTSTPSVACGVGCIPTTDASHHLSQSFLDLAATFTTSGVWTFSAIPLFSAGFVSAGSTTLSATTSISKLGQLYNSATTTTTSPLPIVIATSTGLVSTGNSLLASTTINFIGFSTGNLTAGSLGFVQTEGIVSGFSGLTVGSDYYLQDTGGIGTTPGTNEMYVGTAINTTQLSMEPPHSMQYVGSAAFNSGAGTSPRSVNFTVPPYVREIVITATGGSGTWVSDLTLFRTGKNSANSNWDSVTGGASEIVTGNSCSVSGNTGTCTSTYTNGGAGQSTTESGTAYFYR